MLICVQRRNQRSALSLVSLRPRFLHGLDFASALLWLKLRVSQMLNLDSPSVQHEKGPTKGRFIPAHHQTTNELQQCRNAVQKTVHQVFFSFFFYILFHILLSCYTYDIVLLMVGTGGEDKYPSTYGDQSTSSSDQQCVSVRLSVNKSLNPFLEFNMAAVRKGLCSSGSA
jgi:hypothetical protein